MIGNDGCWGKKIKSNNDINSKRCENDIHLGNPPGCYVGALRAPVFCDISPTMNLTPASSTNTSRSGSPGESSSSSSSSASSASSSEGAPLSDCTSVPFAYAQMTIHTRHGSTPSFPTTSFGSSWIAATAAGVCTNCQGNAVDIATSPPTNSEPCYPVCEFSDIPIRLVFVHTDRSFLLNAPGEFKTHKPI